MNMQDNWWRKQIRRIQFQLFVITLTLILIELGVWMLVWRR